MSISSLLQVLLRHRLVVGAVALLAGLGVVGVVVTSPPTYRASAAVVLLNPPAVPLATITSPAVPAQFQNPYVQFGDLSVVVDILVRVTASQDVINALKAKGLTGTFEIAANRDFYRGPIVDVATEAPTEAGAIKDTELVIKEIQDQLLALQTKQDTDPKYFIKTGTVVGADRATRVFSGTLRTVIAVGGLGGIMTIGAGLLADVVGRRRADRRSRRSATQSDGPPLPDRVEGPIPVDPRTEATEPAVWPPGPQPLQGEGERPDPIEAPAGIEFQPLPQRSRRMSPSLDWSSQPSEVTSPDDSGS